MRKPSSEQSIVEDVELHVEEGGNCGSVDQELVRFLLQSSSEFIIEHDRSGAILQASPVVAAMVGFGLEQILKLSVDAIAESDYLESIGRCFSHVDPARDLVVEGTFIRKDGTRFFARGTAYIPIEGGDSILVFLRPLESRGQQFQITQAQKLESIGQLAAGIAHEINTPTQYVGDNIAFLQDSFHEVLGIVRSLMPLVEDAETHGLHQDQCKVIRDHMMAADFDFLEEEIPKAIAQTLEGIEQISRIVRAMKEFSHPGGDERTLVQINSAIESTITVAKNEWKYVATVEKDLDPSLPMIPILAGDFNQVLLNILVNASHAIAEANSGTSSIGTITVSTRLVDECVEIRFKDTGAGIDERARSRIFDPFFTTKEVGKGTGQGLALAYAIVVEKHGGTITFETEIGQGTTFIIRLPIVAQGAGCDPQ